MRTIAHQAFPGITRTIEPARASLPLDLSHGLYHPSRMTTDGDRIMTTADVCDLYGVSRETVRRWVADGLELAPETPIKPSGRPVVKLFRASIVAAWVAAWRAMPRPGRGPDKAPRRRRSRAEIEASEDAAA